MIDREITLSNLGPVGSQRNSAEAEIMMWLAAASGPTFYYNDLAAAETFYVDEVGLSVVERAADRVVLKIASTSFLTLASGSGGLADAAKATALAVLTNTLDEWDARVTERGLPRMQGKGGGLSFLTRKPGSPHDGCVSVGWFCCTHSQPVILPLHPPPVQDSSSTLTALVYLHAAAGLWLWIQRATRSSSSSSIPTLRTSCSCPSSTLFQVIKMIVLRKRIFCAIQY